jgi:uncharacterized membrane protein HdeD (DUF308 family)
MEAAMTLDDRDIPEPTDPAYRGAKPHALSGPAWGFFEPAGFGQQSAALTALLARNWWVVALRGVFGVLFGLAALFLPIATLASLVLLFAVYMLVVGVLGIVEGVRAAANNQRWGTLVLEGVADLIASAIAFFWPFVTVLAFVFLAGAWAIISGALLVSAAFRLNITHGRWLMILGGAVSVVWGVVLFVWPGPGAVVLTIWLGAYALVFGATLLILSARLYRHRELPAG